MPALPVIAAPFVKIDKLKYEISANAIGKIISLSMFYPLPKKINKV